MQNYKFYIKQLKTYSYLCIVPNFLKRIFAILLLVSFCFYITPKEVLHVFTHHHDTEHLLVNGSHFEEQHHHCELLKIDQAFSAPNVEFPFFDFFENQHFLVDTKYQLYSFIKNENVNLAFLLRGPPVFV